MREKVLKLLALVLAMACLMTAALSEALLEIDLDQPSQPVGVEPEQGSLDLSLVSGEELELSKPTTDDVPSANEGAEIASNEAAALSSNDGDDPFHITDDGVLTKYTGKGGDVIVPDSVSVIGKKAFADCIGLKSVTIPEHVVEIRTHAFRDCENLAYVTILSMKIDITGNAFKGTKPVFRTVIGSTAAEWARQHKLEVEENVVVLTKDTTMNGKIGDTYRIVLKFIDALSYVSSNTAVATVSNKGIVTVRNGGTAQIKVTLITREALTLTLNVPFPRASLSKTSLSLTAGHSAQLTIHNLSGRTVRWASSNTSVATVDNGKVSALKEGKSEITATLSDGTVLKCQVKVNDTAKLNKNKLKLKIGEHYTLKVKHLGSRSVSWSSSKTDVATVQNGKVTAHKAGSCTITAQVQNGKALKCEVTVSDPASLDKTSLKLKIGESRTLKVNHLGGRSVSWSSSDSSVAAVQGGKVTARKGGSCTITAKLSDGKALTCKVTVTDSAKLNKTSLSMKVGETSTLKVSDLGGRSVNWSSSKTDVATVKDGKVTARKAGSCTITAKLSDGKALTCKVTVTDSAKLNKTSLSMKVGETFTLKVSNLGGRSVNWSSSKTDVATVKDGKVTARKAGSCTITARLSDGKTLTCKVTVTDSAKLNKTSLVLKEGATFKLVVTGQGSSTVTWSSSNTNFATVDKTGLVKAVKAGKCTITAKLSNGTSLKCNVTVKKK